MLPVLSSGYSTHPPGIDERIGHMVPEGLFFFDENGEKIPFNKLTDKPAVISLVYLSCTRVCPLILGKLAGTLGEIGSEARDFRAITISFDDKDTRALATEKKRNYIKAAGSFPETSWSFLTGSRESIEEITEAVGFGFRKEEGGFSHPKALIFLSPGGKIVRYLHGLEYSPFDVRMALAEAAGGNAGSLADRLALFCFSYDPFKKKYIFNTLKASALAISILAASFLVFIMISSGSRRKKA